MICERRKWFRVCEVALPLVKCAAMQAELMVCLVDHNYGRSVEWVGNDWICALALTVISCCHPVIAGSRNNSTSCPRTHSTF